jgi:hypothetical protein
VTRRNYRAFVANADTDRIPAENELVVLAGGTTLGVGDGVTAAASLTSIGGGGGSADKLGLTPTAVKTANYSASAGDFVPVDTTSGNVTVTFPTAPADGAVLAVKHLVRGGTNTVSLALGGSDKFNTTTGATTGTLTLSNQSILVQYKSSSAVWFIVAADLSLSGLDARYAQVSNNLSDVTAATARTNLGVGALVGSNTWTGTQDFSGAAFVGPWQYTLAGIGDYIETGVLTGTQNQFSEATEMATPFWVGANITVDRIGVWIGSVLGTVGAVGRLGIRNYNASAPATPGTLLLDGGTFDATTNASSLKTVTVSQALTVGVYWLTYTAQGGAGTRPGICTIANPIVRAPSTSFTNAKYNIGTFGPSGTATGALPNSYGTPSARATDGQAIWFAMRRSA